MGQDPPSADLEDEPGVGFAPAENPGDCFNDLPQIRMDHGLEGMLRRRPGTSGHAMAIDPFKIQTKIDVHRIKATLWGYMHPRLAGKDEGNRAESADPAPGKPEPDQDAPLPDHQEQSNHEKGLQMTDILGEMYGSGAIDSANVSVNSAFICMLHLANEEGLEFVGDTEGDFRVLLDRS